MAQDEQFLSYEQVLQELQVNRSQLNAFIREGRLTEHVMEGETKFRFAEVRDIKRNMEKSPTVMEEERAGEPATDLMEEPGGPPSREPATQLLEEEQDASTTDRETLVLEGGRPSGAAERDTEILDEEEDEFALELPDEDEASASSTALETALELERAAAEKAKESSEEDFFDFTDGLEADAIELEGAGEVEAPAVAALAAEEPEEEGIVTDVLDLGAEEEVAEEDLLSEIMDIEEEQATPGVLTADSTEDITAEITTLEEPTYEDSDLGAVLDVPEEELGPEFGAEAEFAVPYAEPIIGGEERVSGVMVALLVCTLVVMALSLLFVIENGANPDWNTGLTSWARTGS